MFDSVRWFQLDSVYPRISFAAFRLALSSRSQGVSRMCVAALIEESTDGPVSDLFWSIVVVSSDVGDVPMDDANLADCWPGRSILRRTYRVFVGSGAKQLQR